MVYINSGIAEELGANVVVDEVSFPTERPIDPSNLISTLLQASHDDLMKFFTDEKISEDIYRIATDYPKEVISMMPDFKRSSVMKDFREDYNKGFINSLPIVRTLAIKCMTGGRETGDVVDIKKSLVNIAKIKKNMVSTCSLMFESPPGNFKEIMLETVRYSLPLISVAAIFASARRDAFDWNECKKGLKGLYDGNCLNTKSLSDMLKNLEAFSVNIDKNGELDIENMSLEAIYSELKYSFSHRPLSVVADLCSVAVEKLQSAYPRSSDATIVKKIMNGAEYGDASSIRSLLKMKKASGVIRKMFLDGCFSLSVCVFLVSYERYLNLGDTKFVELFNEEDSLPKKGCQRYLSRETVVELYEKAMA